MTNFFSKLKSFSNGANKTNLPQSPVGTSDPAGLQNGNKATPESGSSLSPRKPTSGTPHPSLPWKPLYQRWWVWAIISTGTIATGVGIAAYRLVEDVRADLPDTAEIKTFERDGTLTIKAADGSVLQQLGPATREKLAYDKIPELLVQAFIASEDKNFYAHTGVDYKAIARAVRANLAAGEVVEGGSTITQQLARMVFLDQEQTVHRKLREALLAQKIEQDFDKQEVLERYLNLVYLGSGAYGVADAAWIYFSKSVDQLTLPEIAMIAGLPPAPSAFSPLVDEAAALQRRDIVLQRMVEAGYISTEEMEKAMATPLALKPSQPRNLYSEFPYFTSYIQQELAKHVTPEVLESGGLTVETTLNPAWQRLAEDTVQGAIERYGPGQRFSQAALVSIDPKTGEIKAMVGGNDFNNSQFNRVTQAQRQPGSTFKAIVYTTAIAAGFSPNKTYVDSKFVVDGYEPQNVNKTFRGTVSMREALISSINVVAVQVLIGVGFDPVIELAHRMGIKSDLIPAYSLALGTSEVNLLEITSAYGTLANKGLYVEPHGIVRITNRYGEVIYDANFEAKRAVDEGSAAIVTWMLRGVVLEGTGRNAGLPDRAVAGKTGTSEQKRDLWFIGYIPQLVTGVWLGNDDNTATWGASSTSARVWRNFMIELTDEIPAEEFPELPQLSGREATIEAEPIKPRRMRVNSSSGNSENSERSRSSSQESREERNNQPAQESSEPAREREESRNEAPPEPAPPSNEAPPEPAAAPEPPPPAPEPPPPVEAPPPPEPAPPPVSEPPPEPAGSGAP